jgi:hypothetical protein
MKQIYNSDKICVIINGLGDLICASVAFELFKKTYPEKSIYLITWPGIFAESQLCNPNFTGIYGVNGQPHDQYNWAIKNGFDKNEIIILDNIVNFSRFLNIKIIADINSKIGFDINKLNSFINIYNDASDAIGYWWRTLFALNINLIDGYCLQLLGILSNDYKTRFYCDDSDYKYAESLKDLQPYIVINHTTGTNKQQKEWPVNNWYSLITMLLNNTKFNIITVGNPSDIIIPFNDEKRVKNLRDTKIREIYPIIENSSYYIVSQSGIAWIANCTNNRGLQLNIGGPKEVVSNTNPLCTIIDQNELFNPESLSMEDVWSVLHQQLKGL